MRTRNVRLIPLVVGGLLAGCANDGKFDALDVEALAQSVTVDPTCMSQTDEGKKLFEDSTAIGGNGRTCVTCHDTSPGGTGTINPLDLADTTRFPRPKFQGGKYVPGHVLFQTDAVDDDAVDKKHPVAADFEQVIDRGTIRATIGLNPRVRVVNPKPTSASDIYLDKVTVRRIPPSVHNTIAFAPQRAPMMWDGFLAPGPGGTTETTSNAWDQVQAAIDGHYTGGLATSPPKTLTECEVNQMVGYEGTLVSNHATLPTTDGLSLADRIRKSHAEGAPVLPFPAPPEEPSLFAPLSEHVAYAQRKADYELAVLGRRFFVDEYKPLDPKAGLCALCHAGPNLNEISDMLFTDNSFVFQGHMPTGAAQGRFMTVFVAELNRGADTPHEYVVFEDDTRAKAVRLWPLPDIGLMARTGKTQHNAFFKIPSLWGLSNSVTHDPLVRAKRGNLFHNGFAKNLRQALTQYQIAFALGQAFETQGAPLPSPTDPTALVHFCYEQDMSSDTLKYNVTFISPESFDVAATTVSDGSPSTVKGCTSVSPIAIEVMRKLHYIQLTDDDFRQIEAYARYL